MENYIYYYFIFILTYFVSSLRRDFDCIEKNIGKCQRYFMKNQIQNS